MVLLALLAGCQAAVLDPKGPVGHADKTKAAPGTSFGELVQSAISDTVAASKSAETQMAGQIQAAMKQGSHATSCSA